MLESPGSVNFQNCALARDVFYFLTSIFLKFHFYLVKSSVAKGGPSQQQRSCIVIYNTIVNFHFRTFDQNRVLEPQTPLVHADPPGSLFLSNLCFSDTKTSVSRETSLIFWVLYSSPKSCFRCTNATSNYRSKVLRLASSLLSC